jgi:uncharacterized protein (TIRG00374 family)
VRLAVIAAFVALAVWVANDHWAELEGSADILRHIRWFVVPVLLALEAGAIVCFAVLQRRLFAVAGEDVPLGPLTAVTLGGNAIANTVPGGAAFATAFAYRQFRRLGADPATSVWVTFAEGVVSIAALGVLALVGVIVAAEQASEFNLVGVVVAGTAVTIVLAALAARPGVVARPLARFVDRVLRRFGRPATTERWVDELGAVRPGPRVWAIAFALAAANWLFDCACLVLAFVAVAAPVPWSGILLAYGAGQLAANMPVTPGGLGVVEGSLTLALVAFGGGQTSTVAAVLVYRLVSFWVLAGIGAPFAIALVLRDRAARTGVEAAA